MHEGSRCKSSSNAVYSDALIYWLVCDLMIQRYVKKYFV